MFKMNEKFAFKKHLCANFISIFLFGLISKHDVQKHKTTDAAILDEKVMAKVMNNEYLAELRTIYHILYFCPLEGFVKKQFGCSFAEPILRQLKI